MIISQISKKELYHGFPGQTLEESFEIYVMHELATARDEAGKIADLDFTLDNAGIVMTRTGARGSNLNIGQMVACVGQQSVRGKRIMRGYAGRALPHFSKDDPRPKSKRFCLCFISKWIGCR